MDGRAAHLFVAVPIFLLLSQAVAQAPPIPGAPPFYEPPPFYGAPPFYEPPPFYGAPPFDVGRHMPRNVSCKDILCGSGTCNSSYSSYSNATGSGYSYSYNYTTTGNGSLCGCNKGWSPAFRNGDFWYRPCVVPLCNTSRNCNTTLPEIRTTLPTNFSDPCAWAYCGAGKCVATSEYRYRCDCDAGFRNLFNDTTYPCYNECLIGTDECKKVGATIANVTVEAPGSTESPRGSPSQSPGSTEFQGGSPAGSPGGSTAEGPRSSNKGDSMISGRFVGLTVMLMSLAYI